MKKNSIKEANKVKNIDNTDIKTFENIFRTYYQSLIIFVDRYIFDIALAENIDQEVFLKIWLNREKINLSLNIKAYLYTSEYQIKQNYRRHNETCIKTHIYFYFGCNVFPSRLSSNCF